MDNNWNLSRKSYSFDKNFLFLKTKKILQSNNYTELDNSRSSYFKTRNFGGMYFSRYFNFAEFFQKI